MGNIKISQLAALVDPNKTGVFVEVLDSTDTSMASTGTNKKVEISQVVAGASAASQGYYALLSGYYFDNAATEQTIAVDDVDEWISVGIEPYDSGAAEGTFDYRPTAMKAAVADPISGGQVVVAESQSMSEGMDVVIKSPDGTHIVFLSGDIKNYIFANLGNINSLGLSLYFPDQDITIVPQSFGFNFTMDNGGFSLMETSAVISAEDYANTALFLGMSETVQLVQAAPQVFSLEGLTLSSFCFFRASLSFTPDEDEGELQARLLFNRHSGTVPSDPFPIESIAATMTQGADIEYPSEPILPFFVGDSIDTNGVGDAGTCEFQIKSSVAGQLSVRALTWFINK